MKLVKLGVNATDSCKCVEAVPVQSRSVHS